MSKALIIKNANFATNKVITITFDEEVPCTGIALASDSIEITGDDPVTVQYTLTPSNTTDEVIWTSSDSDVFTVSNGVITPVGLGTATLTATCGQYSDTATVTISVEYIENYAWFVPSPSNNHAQGDANYSRLSALGGGSQQIQYQIGNSNNTKYPAKIPNGISAIKFSYDTSKNSMIYNANGNFVVYWFSDEPSGDSGYDNYAKYLSMESLDLRNASGGTLTVSIPSGANAFVTTFRTQATYTASDDPATIAETLGFEIEFLSE